MDFLGLNFFLSAVWILIWITLAVYLMKKYEGIFAFVVRRNQEEEDHIGVLYDDQVWKTCRRQIHLVCLMGYRMFAFVVLLLIFFHNTLDHERIIFYSYNDSTLALSTIYFLMGSLLSIYRCYRLRRGGLNEEQASPRRVAGLWGYVFQIIYQMLAGAVVLTTCLYWLLIVQMQIKIVHKKLDFIGKTLHLANIVFFLGEAALNDLPFPWFRIAYFGLWTCAYVVFHWILHSYSTFGWPYFFLNLGDQLALLWYFILALVHFPFYGLIYVFIKLKQFIRVLRN